MDLWSHKSVVIITGSTGVLGSAFSHKIASALTDGSHLILASRSKERLAHLKDEINAINPNVHVSTKIWDSSRSSSKFVDKIKEDLQTSSNTLRTFAGQPVRLRSTQHFQNAVLIHNSFDIGNCSQTVEQIGSKPEDLKEILNTNIVIPLAITSAFLDTFGNNVRQKIIVDLTAPCAEHSYPSFGHNAISKSARKMAFDVLAKERTDVKKHVQILHFNPVAVESPYFHAIRDNSHCADVKAAFQSIYKHGKTYSPEYVASVLVALLSDGSFSSGATLGTNDFEETNVCNKETGHGGRSRLHKHRNGIHLSNGTG